MLDYYSSWIAAVQSSMSPRDAAAVVRSILNEQAVAIRTIVDRQRAERENRAVKVPAASSERQPS